MDLEILLHLMVGPIKYVIKGRNIEDLAKILWHLRLVLKSGKLPEIGPKTGFRNLYILGSIWLVVT